jgi:hypothetical protein
MSDRNPLAYTGRVSGSTKVQGDVQFTASQFSVTNGIVSLLATTSAMQYADVTITAAQIKAARATPVSLVAAQGAGAAIFFMGAQLKLNYGSEVFTETADNFAVRYTNGSGAIVSQTIENTGFIDQSADTLTSALPKIDAIVAATGAENKALVLHNTGDGEIGGNASNDSTVTVRVFYQVVSL